MNSVFSFAAHLVAADSFLILEFYFHHLLAILAVVHLRMSNDKV